MKIELRGNSVHLGGYVNVVDRDSRVLLSPTRGKFVEQVRAKTFQRALELAQNVDFLFNHNEQRKLGSTSEGSIKLWEDDIGLRAEAVVSDPEVVSKAKNNELRGWSFAFKKLKDHWSYDSNGIQRRFLEEIILPEVSILDITPAYIATSVEVRSEEEPFEYRYNYADEDIAAHYSTQLMEHEIEILKLRQGTYSSVFF